MFKIAATKYPKSAPANAPTAKVSRIVLKLNMAVDLPPLAFARLFNLI